MTSRAPSVCVVFNNVDERSSIGSLCAWSVRTALEAGWRVSVVARDLDPDLRADVEWLPLYVPPRLHAVQWYAALPTVRRAVGGRSWDVVHTQQPQLTSLADLLHLHYIVRAAREAMPPPRHKGFRSRVGAFQVRLTESGESRALRHLPEHVHLVPVSGMVRDEFERLYGKHPRTTVLDNPGPELVEVSPEERRAARVRFVGERTGPVIGFLGGDDPRKGGSALLDAASGMDAVVLVGGHGGEALSARHASSNVVGVGYVDDRRAFLAACDVFAAVSTFDPGPLTALEASAHGVPVLGTHGCGVVRDLVSAGCAAAWAPGQPLAPAVEQARAVDPTVARAFVAGRSRAAQKARLLEIYERARAEKAERQSRRASSLR